MKQGFFVVGMERDAGTDAVTSAITAALVGRGHRVSPLQPVATGCPLARSNDPCVVAGVPGDVEPSGREALERLAAIAGPPPAATIARTPAASLASPVMTRLLRFTASPAHLDEVCLHRFAPPLEPAVAARLAGVELDLDDIVRALEQRATGADWAIVLGAPGLLAPLTADHLQLELAARLELPLLLVAPSRPGVISAVLLSIAVARARGLPISGVVLARLDADVRLEEAANPYQIERFAGPVVRGVFPLLPPAVLENQELLARLAEAHLDVDALLAPPTAPPLAR